MNENKVLSEFKEKFHPFVEDEASETESLEPGELKSPSPVAPPVEIEIEKKSMPTPTEKPLPKPEKKPIQKPASPSRMPSPLIPSLNKSLTLTIPVSGGRLESYENMYHGQATIYKMAPALPTPKVIPSESESKKKTADTESTDKEKSGSSKKAEKRTRSRSRDDRKRRSGSIIKGSGGFIRRGKFKLLSLDSYRSQRGRNARGGGRGGISRHPSSRFRPATAEE